MTRRSQHPIDQDFHDWDKERKDKRYQYWNACAKMRQEYLDDQKGVYDLTARPRLDYWANEKYGFQMQFDAIDGGITEHYTITDPKKFMMFQIKFWP